MLGAVIAAFPQFTLAQIGATVGLGALLFAVMRWRMNMIRRRNAPREEPRSMSTMSAVNVRQVSVEVEALLGEVEETARRLTAQIDNRYMRLEQLLTEADEKIRRLEQLAQSADAPRGLGPSVPPLSEPVAAVTDAQRALSRLRQERGAPPATQDPAYQPIYSLADRGKSSREIAQELGRQPGEIELILALRQPAVS